MSDTATIGLPEAARRLGITVRALRQAMRAGKVPAPAHLTATTPLTLEWLKSVYAAADARPDAFGQAVRQKVPAFARFEGTSAWRQYHNRAREYARFTAAMNPAG